MRWLKRNLRGNPVWVRLDDAGQPAVDGEGRVEVLYKLAPGAKVYRASPRNLEAVAGAKDEVRELAIDLQAAAASPTASASPRAGVGRSKAPAPAGARPTADSIIIYTDGACTGNPGPMGLGVVIVDRGQRRELSEYLGTGTNNIAELTAILRALQAIPADQRDRAVFVHSDSAYSIGLLTQGWKAKANQELVAELRALCARFADLHFVKVKGHSGVPENERADQLATGAIRR